MACAVVVFGLGVAFVHQATADGFDRVLDDPVIDLLRGHGTLLYWMQYPGTQVPAVVLSVVMAIGCLWQRRLNGVVLALAADLIATRLDDWFLKDLFRRTYLGALSYPSGHTTSIVTLTAVYVVLFLLPPHAAPRRGMRLAGLVALLALAVITVLGVMGLRWHYFTDAAGGAAVAVGTVCALSLALDATSRWLGLTPDGDAPPAPRGGVIPQVGRVRPSNVGGQRHSGHHEEEEAP
jgi:membrane-associated phospholipid phosphatase